MNAWQNKLGRRRFGLWQKCFVALAVLVVLFAACDDGDDPVISMIQASYAGEGEELFDVQVITEDGEMTGFVVTIDKSEYEASGDEWYIWDSVDKEGIPVVLHVWVWQDEDEAAWYEWEQVSLEEVTGDIEDVSIWVHVAEDEDSGTDDDTDDTDDTDDSTNDSADSDGGADDEEDSEEDESVALCMILVTTSSGECVSWWLDRNTVSFTVTDDETGKSASYTITVVCSEGSLVYEVEE